MKKDYRLGVVLKLLILMVLACGSQPALSPPASAPNQFPATVPFTPQKYQGIGDDVFDVDLPHDFIGIVHITGNSSSNHFAVKNLDSANESINLLVNTTERYNGWVPLDWRAGEQTARFEVSAESAWTIEVFGLSAIEKLSIPGSFSGEGDFVFAIIGGTPDIAVIAGNAISSHFAVKSYGSDGDIDLLVNTTDPYSGSVVLDAEALLIEITAEDDWEVEIRTR